MKNIILFLVFVIIATAFASNIQRDCALEAALECKGDVNCIAKVKTQCLDKKTVNKVSPILESVHVVNSNYKNCTRICLSDSNCDCYGLAQTKCSIYTGDVFEACVSDSFSQCHGRCAQNKRCYRLDCRKAGVRRCAKQSRLTCALRHPEDEGAMSKCQEEERACCQRYELATCKKARRNFYNKNICNTEAQSKCNKLSGKAKCRCVHQNRKACSARRVSTYRNNVRKFFDCEQASKILCSEKRCGEEYDQCIQIEKSKCEPVCHKEARIACNNERNGPCYQDKIQKCTTTYRRHFCEKTSKLVCGNDEPCKVVETNTCEQNTPPCLSNPSICDDKNRCTDDVCHPTKGCLHTPVDCDDKNACTTETCDALLGCVYKHKVCDDAVLCTKDTCNTVTGNCEFTFDSQIHHCKCRGGPCKVDSECAAWGVSEELENKCEKAVCNIDLGACVSTKNETCATKCQSTCIPTSACDEPRCVHDTAKNTYECVHTEKKCNDHKNCTTDSCDPKTGCVFKYTPSTQCPPNPICEKNEQCTQWGVQQNLHLNCQKPQCNVVLGICEAVSSNKNCKLDKCRESCKAAHKCETAECIQDGENAYCVKNPIICDDNKNCTSDSCNPETGCVFKYQVTEKCKPGYQCEKNDDCQFLIVSESLVKKCQKPVCDTKQGTCQIVPIDQDCEQRIFDCQEECKPFHACQEAVCESSSQSYELTCKRRVKSCDDNKECTADTCDEINGCRHTYTVSERCPLGGDCKTDNDCFKWSFDNKLSRQCQRAICDQTLGACKAVQKTTKKCVTKTQCENNCKTTNVCESSATCILNDDGDYVCNRVQKSCDDNQKCTLDYCDINTGKCVNKFIPGELCQNKCSTDNECTQWAITQKLSDKCLLASCDLTSGSCVTREDPSPKCVNFNICKKSCTPKDACYTANCVSDEGNSYKCTQSQKNCDDNQKCTVDSCDAVRGCQNIYTVTSECPPESSCKTSLDCIVWGDKQRLASQCKEPSCDTTFGKCVAVPSKDNSCISTTECEKTCKPVDACESAVCVKNNGKVDCVRTKNTCDDKKECTADACDTTTGKCSNIYKVSEKCPIDAQCEKNLDCQKWFTNQQLDETCLTPVCDAALGSCKAVSNGKKCSPRICKKSCPATNECEEPVCHYDVNRKMICQTKRRVCDDNNRCTVDTCDNAKGCVFTHDKTITGCQNPICKNKVDCNAWAVSEKLESKCQEAVCDVDTYTCKSILINTKDCNPKLKECQETCRPRTACETAVCNVEPTTQVVTCQRTPINCDDGNTCTKDVCDDVKGCKFTYEKSVKCPQYCKLDVDCAEWAIASKLSASCQIAKCDQKTTSCYPVKDETQPGCKPVTEECKLVCKPNNACDTVTCDRKAPGSNEISCVHTPNKCDDNLDCTVDSCDEKTGCKHEFKKTEKCVAPCAKDIDCKQWGENEKLIDKCELAFCNLQSGSCDKKAGPQTAKCLETNDCTTANDCATSKFGSTCCTESGRKKCCQHKCRTDSDCVPKSTEEWGYCRKKPSGQFDCEYKPKCKGNEDCDDKNPCTRDVCLTDYGFCKNQPRCVDNSECTEDICIPSKDLKTYTCKNPTKSCTRDQTLLDKNFSLLTKEQQTKWLGQCSHLEGCVTCVVNAQCDDNKGCTADSCENQFCVHRPIHNEWCDPKLEGQPITVEALDKFIRPWIRA